MKRQKKAFTAKNWKLKTISAIIIIASLSTGCNLARRIAEVPVQTIVEVIETLVPIILPPDSTAIVALLECDSLNQVIIRQLSESKSSKVSTSVALVDNTFSYSATIAKDTVYLRRKDSIITREVPVIQEVPYYVNQPKKWQKWLMWFGALSIIGGLVGAVIKLKKFFI